MNEYSFNAIGHQENQQNGDAGSTVIVSLQAVGNHVPNASGPDHAENGTFGKVGLQTHARPCDKLKKIPFKRGAPV